MSIDLRLYVRSLHILFYIYYVILDGIQNELLFPIDVPHLVHDLEFIFVTDEWKNDRQLSRTSPDRSPWSDGGR